MGKSLFEMVYGNLTEEEKELKKTEMREAKQLKDCIMKRLINKFNNKTVADLFYYNVVAIGTQKGARHDYLEALKVLTAEEIDEIEKRVTGGLYVMNFRAIKKATTRPREEALQAIKCFYCPYFTKDKGAFQCINEIFY